MARPRKNAEEPQLSDRLVEAFWRVLETTDLHDVTVRMVTDEAGCNRGTFYYHYASINALVYSAIEGLLLGDRTVPQTVFALAANAHVPGTFDETVLDQRFRRFVLIMQQGEMLRVDAVVKSVAASMWRAALRPDGELKPETLLVIDSAVGGVMSLITRALSDGCGPLLPPSAAIRDYLEASSMLTVETVCRIEEVDKEAVCARVRELTATGA